MNIDDINQGGMVEDMQSDIKRSKTKSNLLVDTHSVITGQKEEVENNHSGMKKARLETQPFGRHQYEC